MLTELSASYREIYGLICGTPTSTGILEWMRSVDAKLAEILHEREEARAEAKRREGNNETRFWNFFRVIGPWALGLLALYLGLA